MYDCSVPCKWMILISLLSCTVLYPTLPTNTNYPSLSTSLQRCWLLPACLSSFGAAADHNRCNESRSEARVTPASAVMSQAAAAPLPQQAGSAPSLPGYYTAYWAQQQQQLPPQPTAAAPPAVPHPYVSALPPYAHYPATSPSFQSSATVPSVAALPLSSAPSAVPPSSAATTPAEAAAAYAKYQEDYARWYNQYYLPYTAYATQHSQAAAIYPQHPPPPAAHSQPHATQNAQQPPPAVQPHPAANLAPYGYPHPPSTSQPHQSPHPSSLQSPQHSAAPLATSPRTSHLAGSSTRSRWGLTDESAAHQPQPSAHQTAASSAASAAPPSSSSSVVWPPSVIEYVKRSLVHCPAGQRVEVEAWMRERLQSAVNDGSMHATDWGREPPAHVRKLAEELSKRYNGTAATHPSIAPHAARHEPVEKRNVDEERREWEEHRRLEQEEEKAARTRRPYFHDDRLALSRDLKKRSREDEEKSFAHDQSSSDDEDDIQHFLTSSYNNKQLSKREQRRQKRKAKQLQHSKASGANGKAGIWRVDNIDEERNLGRANRFAEYVQQAASTPLRTRIRTDLFTFSAPSSSGFGGDEEDGDIDWSALKIVGTSTSLEKSYFRLTSPPSPSVVRPPPILSAALARLLSLHASGERNYAYLCDQMKAIRQDLTVQGVKGDVAVRVYEEHARMAIQVGDMSEYNQCQTQLMVLYAEKPPRRSAGEANGAVKTKDSFREEKETTEIGTDEAGVWESETEFLMYRLCYYLLVNNQPAIASYLRTLTPHQRSLPAVQHVLDLRSAVACDDFHAFLARYKATPYLGSTLLQHLCPRMRWLGVQVLVRGYKPTRVDVDVFTQALAFAEQAACVEFMVSCGAALSEDRQVRLRTYTMHVPPRTALVV